MSARFAGSRHLDERRRRRLAVESDEAPADAAGGAGGDVARSRRRTRGFGSALTHFPLRKLISCRQWKLWLVIVAIGLAGASVVAAGVAGARDGSGWPAAATLLAPAGPVARTFSGTLLLIAAQLAVVIWWARSRSLGDFSGRYRVWMWAAATLFAWAFCLATDGHAVLGATAQQLWPLDVPSAATLYWLVPASVWLLLLLRAIDHELVECRLSRGLLWLGAAATIGSAGLSLAPEWMLAGADRATIATIAAALATAGPVLLFASLLQHARHVIYVTPEPPPRPTPLWRRGLAVLRFAARLIRVPSFRRTDRAATAAGATPDNASSGTASRRGKSRRAEREGARPSAASAREQESADPPSEPPEIAAVSPSDSAESRPAFDERERASVGADHTAAADDDFSESEIDEPQARSGSQPAPASTKAAGTPPGVRIDAAVDKDLLKGLSKRERRQLRKQLKDERRRAAQQE